jgi:ribonucleoside-diphosphate reductase alpha chain
MDNTLSANPKPENLQHLREIAVHTNEALAQEIGINKSASITCVKPSGTVSQLVDSASGIHSRHSPYYIRRVRMDAKDPMTTFMQDLEWVWEPDNTKPNETVVFLLRVQRVVSQGRSVQPSNSLKSGVCTKSIGVNINLPSLSR